MSTHEAKRGLSSRGEAMIVAYLVTEYPKVTHTFIRREIKAVEKMGIDVLPISIRLPEISDLPEGADREELKRTFGVLDRGVLVAVDMWVVALRRPKRWVETAARAVRLGVRSERGLARHIIYFVEACVVSRFAEKRGVDHIHAHFGKNATMVAMLANDLGGPPYSFMMHGPIEFDCPAFIHIPEKVKGSRFVTAITDFAKSQTLRWSSPNQWSKVHVVRCGVDEQFLDGDPEPVPDVPRFVNIGRLGGEKAQPLIVQAAANLRDQGRQFEVIIIGDGELRRHLEGMIADLRLESYVKLVGWKSGDEVKQELLRSRALLLPSFAEGLPVVIMEAFALARPVITTKIAGISELVVDGENGWLLPSGNLDSIVRAMGEALDTSAEELSAMGARGREAVRAKHNAASEGKKLAKLLFESHR